MRICTQIQSVNRIYCLRTYTRILKHNMQSMMSPLDIGTSGKRINRYIVMFRRVVLVYVLGLLTVCVHTFISTLHAGT
jgi:hypothetical protein